jgi:hypothetical protein
MALSSWFAIGENTVIFQAHTMVLALPLRDEFEFS